MPRTDRTGPNSCSKTGLAALVFLLFPAATAMAQEDRPEVLHCARIAHAVKAADFEKFAVQLKRFRSMAGVTRVNLAYAGIDADGAGSSGAFECRYKMTETRNGNYRAATVFIDNGRLTREALDKYNDLVGSR